MTAERAGASRTAQLPLPLDYRRSLGEQDFLVSDCNVDAVGWVDRWPDWPAPALVVLGPPASGKSHLAAVWAKRAGALVLDIASPAWRDPAALAGRPLVIDGVDRWAGDAAVERALFLLYSAATPMAGMVFTGRIAPARLDFAVPDLASRLRGAPTARITEPDDDLLAGVMAKQFADRQITVDERALGFLVRRIDRSFAAARHWVDRLHDAVTGQGRGHVTVKLASQVLEEAGESPD
jgi:chromosomal replication initiation ATPase DnaA